MCVYYLELCVRIWFAIAIIEFYFGLGLYIEKTCLLEAQSSFKEVEGADVGGLSKSILAGFHLLLPFVLSFDNLLLVLDQDI